MTANRDLVLFAVLAAGAAALTQRADAQTLTILGPGEFVNAAGSTTTFQSDPTNLIGIAQTGTGVSAVVSQMGTDNRAVVVQVGPSPSATITQSGGLFNKAYIVQFGPNPVASIAQDGQVNTAGIAQPASAVSSGQIERLAQNLLFAPETIGAQTELAQVAARGLGGLLFRHLEVGRGECPKDWSDGTWSADPGRAIPPVRPSPTGCRPFSLFTTGSYDWGRQDDRFGVTGYDYHSGWMAVGSEYRLTPGLRVGAAFGYGLLRSDLNHSRGTVAIDSYQAGLFGSLSYPNWFADAAVTYGGLRLDVKRPGFTAPVAASPDGTTFLAGLRGGYLFDVGAVQLGPIAGLAYAKDHIEHYTEQGDPLLVQNVDRQTRDSLVTSVGMRTRVPFQVGTAALAAYADLTAEREMLDAPRSVQSGFALFRGLPISTPLSDKDRTYGKFSGGLTADFGGAISATLVAERTFARAGGDDFSVTAALVGHF